MGAELLGEPAAAEIDLFKLDEEPNEVLDHIIVLFEHNQISAISGWPGPWVLRMSLFRCFSVVYLHENVAVF